jgi:hypothetical protein
VGCSRPRQALSRNEQLCQRRCRCECFGGTDGLCRWCRRPVIFAPAMKYLARFMQEQGHKGLLAYWSSAYRRDASPLLDELAAAVDHVTPFSAGERMMNRTLSRRATSATREKVPARPTSFTKNTLLVRLLRACTASPKLGTAFQHCLSCSRVRIVASSRGRRPTGSKP